MTRDTQQPLLRRTLDNGLRVVALADRSNPLVAVNLWYQVGSRDDPPRRTGLAHLFEHMLFQGSANVAANDHFRYIQQVGGAANGSTWFDRTNYYETLPAHHLELGLWLEADRMGFLLEALDGEKLETQRQVVLNERRQRVDNQPYGGALERLQERLYPPPHPYGWPVIGYAEDIVDTELADLRTFFSTYYAPNNAVLSLVGDFEPERAFELVERYFGEIPSGPSVEQGNDGRPQTGLPEPVDGENRELIVEDDVQLTRHYFGFTVPAYGEDAWYAAQMLAIILTGGRSSPLHQDLVYDRQLAQDVSAMVFPTQLAATFLLVTTARPEADPEELRLRVVDHLDLAGRELQRETQLARCRNQVTTAWYDRLQTVGQRADLLSQLTTFFDRPQRLLDEADRYRAVDAPRIRDLAAEYLCPERQVTVTVVPRGGQGTVRGPG